MPSKGEIIAGVSSEAKAFLERRVGLIESEISAFLNVNPFLLRCIRDLHGIDNQDSLAEYLLIYHLAVGHATGFGKMIDEKILPGVFGTTRLDAKTRRSLRLTQSIFDDIDHIAKINGNEFLLSVKAGAWTIQHGQAMQIYGNFKALGEKGLSKDGIVVGVFYGHKGLLTNKYDIVRGINPRHQAELTPLDFVSVKAGKEFWSWLNGGEMATQDWVMEGIRAGANKFFKGRETAGRVADQAKTRLKDELRAKYGLPKDGSLDWPSLLHAINDEPEG